MRLPGRVLTDTQPGSRAEIVIFLSETHSMKEETVFFGLIVLLVLVVASAFVLGNLDPIPAAVAKTKAEFAAGTSVTSAAGLGVSWLFKLAVGSFVAGLGAAFFRELWKAYKLWKANASTGRWKAGPNAYWGRGSQSPRPRLTRNDLMFLSLLQGKGIDPRPYVDAVNRDDDPEEPKLDINL